jgi:putative solute:sodium symporter small subunit
MTVILLLVWLLTGFFSIFFARELDQLRLFGWPLSFYLAAQGSSLIYLAVVGFYAWRMQRLDRQYRAQDQSKDQEQEQEQEQIRLRKKGKQLR